MLYFIICALTNLFRMYIIHRFVSVFFAEEKTNKKLEFCAYAFFYVANTSLFWIYHTAWINVLCNLICMCIIVCLHTKSVKTIVFITCSIYIINMGCDIAATMLFINYEDGKAHSQVYAVISVFFIFISEALTEKLINSRRNLDASYKFPLIFVPMSSILVLWILLYSDVCEDMGIAIVSMGLLIINFLMLYLYNMLIQSITKKYEAELLQQQVRIYSNQLDVITQSEEKVKALRHDMKHHMNEIKLLANKYNAIEIQKYVDSMETFIHNKNEIVASGNIEIDSVLNYMLQRARDELKTVKSKIVLPEEIIHYFDINVLIGNLLENAIEAATQTEEKFLYVSVVQKKGVLQIKVVNSLLDGSSVRMKSENGEILWRSTKKDKEQHGIGLKNVKKIVEAYNGTMETEVQDNKFCVKLILYMMKVENEE